MVNPFIKASRRALRRVGDDMVLIDAQGSETPVKGLLDDPEALAVFESKLGTVNTDMVSTDFVITLSSEYPVAKGWLIRHAQTLYRVARKPLDDGNGLYHCCVEIDTQRTQRNVKSEYGQFN